MNPELLQTLPAFTLKLGALTLLGYALSQARRVTNDIAANAGQFGDDNEKKKQTVFRAIFNFYLTLATIVVVVCGLFELFPRELFIGLLVALLTGLGVKMSYDIKS